MIKSLKNKKSISCKYCKRNNIMKIFFYTICSFMYIFCDYKAINTHVKSN